MDRRGFIGWIGGLMAVSALPGCRRAKRELLCDDPSLFPNRDPRMALSLEFQHIQAGATEPFSVLHISDTHFTAAYEHEDVFRCGKSRARAQVFGGRQEEAFRDSLIWAKANCDYVLHTGDLIDFQSEANFDLVRKYYGETVFGPVGNHEFYTYLPDEKRTGLESFKDRSWPILRERYPADARFSSKIVNGVNFICLDNVFGRVACEQVEAFRAEAKRGLPMILCMHVPFFTDELHLMAKRYWADSGHNFRNVPGHEPNGDWERQMSDKTTVDFIAYLKSEKLLRGLLVGHEHVTMQDRFSETAMEYVVGGNFMFHGQEVLFT